MLDSSRRRSFLHLVRNLALVTLLYVCIHQAVLYLNDKAGAGYSRDEPQESVVAQAYRSGFKARFKLAGSGRTVTINPYANVFNRPESAVTIRDDYLGSRPHVDTEADLNMLVEECRGSYDGIEKMRRVFDCIRFLADAEERYFFIPDLANRASEQDPRVAEYRDADGQGNSRTRYVSIDMAEPPSNTTLGSCPGPIIPYHVYWTGPATWRVEIFIKSYLHTQNLACSRLWLWLDADKNPTAVEDMLNRDPLFAGFLPLVERGDITVKEWKFPSRVPLPRHRDNTDGVGYYHNRGRPDANGESVVADGIIEDANRQQWLVLTARQMTFLPVAVSDAVRFVVLHLHGGVYFDMDVLMLRDMRPLLIPKQHSFAERWAAHPHPSDYNTAIMSLSANSSLSSYLLRGGVRMGLNFHPRVIGRMAWKDGRDRELLMLETALFDPIWTEFNSDREGRCTIPCLRDYGAAFKGKAKAIRNEWESYDGPRLNSTIPPLKLHENGSTQRRSGGETGHNSSSRIEARAVDQTVGRSSSPKMQPMFEPRDSFNPTAEEQAELENAGVIADYRTEEDKFPPNNRTLENFFRGSFTYHIHNQWFKHPEPSSWFAVIQSAHDGFFAGRRTNAYGERWAGPSLPPYRKWVEFV